MNTPGTAMPRLVPTGCGRWCGLLVLLLGFASRPVLAASEARTTLSLIVPPIQRLEIETPTLVMPDLTASDLRPGYVLLPRVLSIRVSSNTAWVLQMRAAEGKPGSDPGEEVQRVGTNESFRTIADDWLTVAEGESGIDQSVELRLRVSITGAGSVSGAHESRFDYRLSGVGE
ncbi:MAG: hypothetical protein R3E12_00965 [Candidatus Eisenbacteria bacterium]|uniref:Uncharacterized protein n=1 Tax=Eiseniibacteriota bacterium TaxID=2212470 RepID=A0A956M1E1_UNCEI|nr:hypothetical protein [Candidatus Eisenbacteria bacterium]